MSSRLTAILLVFLSTVLSLIALEVGTRLIDHVPVFSTENFVAKTLDANTNNPQARFDAQVGWRQVANLKWGDTTTGDYGIRMPSTEIRPIPQGGILVVGDSFAAGSEVADDQSWPAQLEGMVDRPVNNAGIGGFALDQTVLLAEDLVPRLHPQMLVVELTAGFSLYTKYSVFGGSSKPYFTIENDALVRHNDPVPRHASSVRSIGQLRQIFGYSYLVQFVMIRFNALQWWAQGSGGYLQEYSDEEASKVTCLLMARLAAFGKRSNVPIGVVIQYGGPEGLLDAPLWYAQHLDACVQEQGLKMVDTFKALHDVLATKGLDGYRRLWVMHENNRAYGHMSKEGNQLVASLIAAEFFGSSMTKLH